MIDPEQLAERDSTAVLALQAAGFQDRMILSQSRVHAAVRFRHYGGSPDQRCREIVGFGDSLADADRDALQTLATDRWHWCC